MRSLLGASCSFPPSSKQGLLGDKYHQTLASLGHAMPLLASKLGEYLSLVSEFSLAGSSSQPPLKQRPRFCR
jgi:hypothetical protein